VSWFQAPKQPSRRVAVYWTKADGSDLRADGFLEGIRHGHYVLAHAELVTGVHNRASDAGTFEIPAGRVDFIQILGGAE
jgi:hypothetical protein